MSRKNYRGSISQADDAAASGKRREPVNLFITVLIRAHTHSLLGSRASNKPNQKKKLIQ